MRGHRQRHPGAVTARVIGQVIATLKILPEMTEPWLALSLFQAVADKNVETGA
jgi:hypothetical protein